MKDNEQRETGVGLEITVDRVLYLLAIALHQHAVAAFSEMYPRVMCNAAYKPQPEDARQSMSGSFLCVVAATTFLHPPSIRYDEAKFVRTWAKIFQVDGAKFQKARDDTLAAFYAALKQEFDATLGVKAPVPEFLAYCGWKEASARAGFSAAMPVFLAEVGITNDWSRQTARALIKQCLEARFEETMCDSIEAAIVANSRGQLQEVIAKCQDVLTNHLILGAVRYDGDLEAARTRRLDDITRIVQGNERAREMILRIITEEFSAILSSMKQIADQPVANADVAFDRLKAVVRNARDQATRKLEAEPDVALLLNAYYG